MDDANHNPRPQPPPRGDRPADPSRDDAPAASSPGDGPDERLESFVERLKDAGVVTTRSPATDGIRLTFALDPQSPDAPPTHRGLFPEAGPLSLVWRGGPGDAAAEAVVRWLRADRDLEHWRRQAVHDPLTGLANRRGWEERLDAARSGPFGMTVLDLDHFKDWNTRGGHLVGDELLRSFAEHLRQAAGPNDFAARIGGDEFSFVTFDPDFDRFARRVEHVRKHWSAAPRKTDAHGRPLSPSSVSVGLGWRSAGPSPGEGWHAIFAAADAALGESKTAGRNRVTIVRLDD